VKARGFEEDESFWEVGLHLFLFLLFGLPLAFLIEFLARLAKVQDRGPAFMGLLFGLAVGGLLVGRLRRRFGETPATPQPGQYWNLILALPIGLAFMALADRFDTLLPPADSGFFGILGLFAGAPIAHRVFHRLRGTWRRTPKDG
jgi:hypothetical protein